LALSANQSSKTGNFGFRLIPRRLIPAGAPRVRPDLMLKRCGDASEIAGSWGTENARLTPHARNDAACHLQAAQCGFGVKVRHPKHLVKTD
jgi:hypothetical protein